MPIPVITEPLTPAEAAQRYRDAGVAGWMMDARYQHDSPWAFERLMFARERDAEECGERWAAEAQEIHGAGVYVVIKIEPAVEITKTAAPEKRGPPQDSVSQMRITERRRRLLEELDKRNLSVNDRYLPTRELTEALGCAGVTLRDDIRSLRGRK